MIEHHGTCPTLYIYPLTRTTENRKFDTEQRIVDQIVYTRILLFFNVIRAQIAIYRVISETLGFV